MKYKAIIMLIFSALFLMSCDKDQGPLGDDTIVEEDLDGFDVSNLPTDLPGFKYGELKEGELTRFKISESGQAYIVPDGNGRAVDPTFSIYEVTVYTHVSIAYQKPGYGYTTAWSGFLPSSGGVGFELDPPNSLSQNNRLNWRVNVNYSGTSSSCVNVEVGKELSNGFQIDLDPAKVPRNGVPAYYTCKNEATTGSSADESDVIIPHDGNCNT